MRDDRASRATERYELATFGGDPSELALADRDLDADEADLAARGRIAHARFFMDGVQDPLELASFGVGRLRAGLLVPPPSWGICAAQAKIKK